MNFIVEWFLCVSLKRAEVCSDRPLIYLEITEASFSTLLRWVYSGLPLGLVLAILLRAKTKHSLLGSPYWIPSVSTGLYTLVDQKWTFPNPVKLRQLFSIQLPCSWSLSSLVESHPLYVQLIIQILKGKSMQIYGFLSLISSLLFGPLPHTFQWLNPSWTFISVFLAQWGGHDLSGFYLCAPLSNKYLQPKNWATVGHI